MTLWQHSDPKRRCMAIRPKEDWKHIGRIEVDDGEWVDLYNCPVCFSTVSQEQIVEVRENLRIRQVLWVIF